MSESLATTETKAWYQKPENILVYGGLALGGYFVLQGLDKILPLLNRVLENMLYTSVLFGGLAVVGFLLVNGDFHRLAWYGYKSAMRWITGRFVELDPIGIMQSYVETLGAKQEQIKKSLGALRGQAQSLDELIKTTARAHDESMSMAAAAKNRAASGQKGMRTEMQLQARKAGRAEQSALTYQGLLNKIMAHIALIEKVDEASKFMILDLEDTIEVESKKREMIHASYKAMSAAKRILAADKQREMYDMALESTTKDYFAKLGEITQFVEDSEHFINTMDLQNGAFETDALAKLEQWEERANGLLEGGSGDTKYKVLTSGTTSSAGQLISSSTPRSGDAVSQDRQSFTDLFSKLDNK
jgi:hypothetical protein